MNREIDELIKLEKYDNLTHDEVIKLINHFSFLAKCNAQCEVIRSESYIQSELEKMRILEMYDTAKLKLYDSNTELKDLRKKLAEMQLDTIAIKASDNNG